ncbi:MAG: DUF2155 domain-containing protein [Desulfovibrionales bacterium]|nr:DUF2155 domain-containing protein [Desulfovibrionales bacterium]
MDTFKKIGMLAVPLIAGGILLAGGCQKKEDIKTAQEKPAMPSEPSMHEPAPDGQEQMPPAMGKQFPKEMLEAIQRGEQKPESRPVTKGHAPVVVPREVQGKWKAVVIAVVNKQTNEKKDYVVGINKDFALPNSKIKIKVLNFLPNFSMSPQGITSLSNESKNPAAQIIVYEDNKNVFEGWLFEKFPQVHPFQHKVYAIMLKNQMPI